MEDEYDRPIEMCESCGRPATALFVLDLDAETVKRACVACYHDLTRGQGPA